MGRDHDLNPVETSIQTIYAVSIQNSGERWVPKGIHALDRSLPGCWDKSGFGRGEARRPCRE